MGNPKNNNLFYQVLISRLQLKLYIKILIPFVGCNRLLFALQAGSSPQRGGVSSVPPGSQEPGFFLPALGIMAA
jgi:hypothetical protein